MPNLLMENSAVTANEESKSEACTCHFCGEALDEESALSFDGFTLCETCYDERITTCEHCGREMWVEDDCGDENIRLCETCRDYHYVTCCVCGYLVRDDFAIYRGDDNAYCVDCAEELDEQENERAIHDYGFKPEPIFYGDGPLFMGVELEIDKGGESNAYAERISEVANRCGQRIYCKRDGSLNDGFEIVSHPMTLDYHMQKMNWRELMEEAVRLGYRSHQTSTCGLHVHVSREAFGRTCDEQEAAISRVVFFVENHWNNLVVFSRRHPDQLNHWCSRYGIGRDAKDTYSKVKDSNPGRYVAVNLENEDTVEFRLFRGTLRYETFIAALQLVHEICTLAVSVNDETIEAMPWSDFVRRIDPQSKPELVQYLKSKYLYINEETTREENDL